jgi:Mycothiol maleylpyruvate isomerase N-terminal domain
MDVSRLLAEEEEGWDRLCGVFASIPDDRFEEPTLTPEGWSPKDAMFHVGAWLQDCAEVLERIRQGTFRREEVDEDIESTNRAWFERSRGMAADEVRAGFFDGRRRVIASFTTLPRIPPDAWEWFEESGPLHYAKHVKDLEAWLG